MLIEGEKYACDACVRGHRVSSCTHTDRLLIHINKKGRPVSQCPHCRGLRKARAQHVKCDCAEKSHTRDQCTHDKGKGKKGEKGVCCCSHGARCICALKKEPSLDSVPEDLPSTHIESRSMREGRQPSRLSFVSSRESTPTVSMNSHNKPVRKKGGERGGAPYKVPVRSNTISGGREFGKRSTENHSVAKEFMGGMSNTPPRSVTSAPQPVRRAKSEHGSPTISAIPMHHDNYVPPISIPSYDPNVYSYSPYSHGSPSIPSGRSSPWDGTIPDQFPDNYFVSYETANEIEMSASPVPYGSDCADVDWSTYNLPNRPGNVAMGSGLPGLGFAPSQPPSNTSFDCYSHLSQHDFTPSSGDMSEIDDFVPVPEPSSLHGTSQDALADFSGVNREKHSDIGHFRSNSASSYGGTPPVNMISSHNPEQLDIDDFMKSAEARSLEMAVQNQRMQQRQQQQQPSQQILQQQPPPLPQLQPSSITSNPQNMFGQPPDSLQHPFPLQESLEYGPRMDQVNAFRRDNMNIRPISMENSSITSYPYTVASKPSNTEERDDSWVR